MNAMTEALRISEASILFDGRGEPTLAVDKLSLTVRPGEFVSLVGPSGCGKSTLLNVIGGFQSLSSGEAVLGGASIDGPGPERGMVFQQYSLFPWLTVAKNVEYGLKMQGVPATRRRDEARQLLTLVGLAGFERHYPDQLSGGMKQRVAIARALAPRPRVLLLDEPFAALDAQTRVLMREVLTDVWEKLRTTVVFVTHDIEEAVFLSDRIIALTSRPARVKAEIDVPLPRPRDYAMLDLPEFQAIARHLRHLIRDESIAAMRGEGGDESNGAPIAPGFERVL